MWMGSNVRRLADLDDLHPDTSPSRSGFVIENRGADTIEVIRVKGLGVLVFREEPSLFLDKPDKGGVATFTEAEVRNG